MATVTRYLLLLSLLYCSAPCLYAQNDEYLDDTYLSRTDIKTKQEKKREQTRLAREKRLAQERLWQEEYEREQQKLQAQQRSREIDAYNGILSREDSLLVEADAKLYARRAEQSDKGWSYREGNYSRRFKRFHSERPSIVINNYYDDDYLNPYWHQAYLWAWDRPSWAWSTWQPWYSDYPSYHHSFYYGYYPYWGYTSRYYAYPYGSYFPSYYYERVYPVVVSTSPSNSYRGASRSAHSPYRSGYAAYEHSRQQRGKQHERIQVEHNSSYRGTGRSIHNDHQVSRESYRSVPQPSYTPSDGGSSPTPYRRNSGHSRR